MKVEADFWRVNELLDAMLRELIRRSDARKHEYLWRTNGAAANDDFPVSRYRSPAGQFRTLSNTLLQSDAADYRGCENRDAL